MKKYENKFDLLLLGEPAAGKTNLMAMLDAVWTIDPSPIIKRKIHVKDALSVNPLLQGYLADPTSKEFDQSIWKLEYKNQNFDISLPEYKGEEFDQLRHSLLTEWSNKWQERLQNSQAIILIIPSTNDPARDLISPPTYSTDLLHNPTIDDNNNFSSAISHELFNSRDLSYIHFLQSLLILRNISRKEKKQLPLWIFLSQWDLQNLGTEIKSKTSQVISPKVHLSKIFPWFYSYIQNNWDDSFLKIYGISALGDEGKNLLSAGNKNPEEEYKIARKNFMKAPHQQGWAVNDKGDFLDILTPFSELLDVLKKD
ncbi:hypothetical protein [Acinetobacter pittii]|uniref:TRAFAC clade GTPase domain-containing protein n=1 Tax=Acinetobacter pittii TaxID=48296 RepID=UPI00192A999B|nr:hypothetical protein [Acinetobacter pittii]